MTSAVLCRRLLLLVLIVVLLLHIATVARWTHGGTDSDGSRALEPTRKRVDGLGRVNAILIR